MAYHGAEHLSTSIEKHPTILYNTMKNNNESPSPTFLISQYD